jgi:hypothetical protein
MLEEEGEYMKRLRVREGNTGILFMTDTEGHQDSYIPDSDLDKARELLLEFQELKDDEGRLLKNNYRAEGFNWYPSMVANLYWHVFFGYVRYKPIVDQYMDGDINFKFENSGSLSQIVSVLQMPAIKRTWKIRLLFKLAAINNRLIPGIYKVPLFFYRFSETDFRTKEIKQVLDEMNVRYIQVMRPTQIKDVFRNILRRDPYYFFGSVPAENIFKRTYRLDNLDWHKRVLFEKAIAFVEWSISGYIAEYTEHCLHLKGDRPRVLYGLDDSHGYIFPMLYACRQNGIRTVAHQHGLYAKRLAGYVMEGIAKGDCIWFDRVIVWGDYWKDHFLRMSDVHSPDMFVVGSNKLQWDYTHKGIAGRKIENILIPYEWLPNTYKIGLFIQRFIDLGYNIYFKARSDEAIQDQLDAYCLPLSYREKVHIVEKLDSAFMEIIDIVAGSMTSLIYELLPYEKIVWILETEYRLLEDLVEDGYGHHIKFEDLKSLDDKYFTFKKVDAEYFFNPQSLRETLTRHVLSA